MSKTEPTIEFEIPVLTPMLNEWQRLHWSARQRMKTAFAWDVRAALGQWNKPAIEKCRIEIDRYSSANRLDWDGLYGGAKPLIDSLTLSHPTVNPHGLGIIVDDNTNVITKLTINPLKAKQRQGRTVVRIYAIE